MIFIATFHTHFGAMDFSRTLKKLNYSAEMMPVPRVLSASCGVCIKFYECNGVDYSKCSDLDCVYEQKSNEHILIYDAE
ncbi:MAG: DUF3343 domain-containing protein [Oscillospiraceae bacterium]